MSEAAYEAAANVFPYVHRAESDAIVDAFLGEIDAYTIQTDEFGAPVVLAPFVDWLVLLKGDK